MFLLAAMGPPGGGRMVISRRLQSRFNLINMTFPQESQIKRIFGTMINQKLQDFDEDVKPLGDVMTQATIEIYNTISTRMLPTPAKIHYLFNLRDISRVSACMIDCILVLYNIQTLIRREGEVTEMQVLIFNEYLFPLPSGVPRFIASSQRLPRHKECHGQTVGTRMFPSVLRQISWKQRSRDIHLPSLREAWPSV